MKALGAILPALLAELKLEGGTAGWRAVLEWSSIAGERVAKRARAVSFRDGELTVEVDGSAWMHELGFLERELVQRANQHVGANVIQRLRFVRAHGGKAK